MSELVQLAERFVRVTAELDAIRASMKKLLLNGADPAHPTRAQRPGAQKRPQRQSLSPGAKKRSSPQPHWNAAGAAKAEAKIVELVRSSPGMRTSAIAKATSTGATTVAGRLKRLQARSLVERHGEGWRVSAGGSRPNEARANPTS